MNAKTAKLIKSYAKINNLPYQSVKNVMKKLDWKNRSKMLDDFRHTLHKDNF